VKLKPASAWIKETFECGVSTERVRAWVENKIIPGVIIDDKTFVDADKAAVLLDTCTHIQRPAEQYHSTGNSTVANIMQGAMTR
tara:strand:+ start:508 stop:759 length:252 start_codon:yes stop_codon:yes gene_type:complete